MIGTPEHLIYREKIDKGQMPGPTLYVASPEFTGRSGKRADLVLLTANPLDNIANTEKRAGVMARGRWLPQPELQKQLDEIALRFQNQ
jgi:hypothetical protein